MKKLKKLEEAKKIYVDKTLNPKKNSDDEDDEGGKPPIASKEISKSLQVKEDLRQGVQHMVKFTRLSKSDKLSSAGQKTPGSTTKKSGGSQQSS